MTLESVDLLRSFFFNYLCLFYMHHVALLVRRVIGLLSTVFC